MTPWPLVAAQNTQISMALVVEQLLNSYMAIDGSPNTGHPLVTTWAMDGHADPG